MQNSINYQFKHVETRGVSLSTLGNDLVWTLSPFYSKILFALFFYFREH